MNKEVYTNRIRVVIGFFVFLSLILFIRLFYVQVLHNEEYVRLASRQYVAPKENTFDRGSIFFKTKDGELLSGAARMTGYTLAITPKDITNPETVYTKLLEIVPDLDKEDFNKKAAKVSDPYEEIAKMLSHEQKEKIEELRIRAVHLHPEYYRYYPYQDLGSQVLGFVGWNKEDKLTGQYGLERYYNDVLSRSDGGVYVNFFAEVFADLSRTLFSSDDAREGDLVLTIEPNAQVFAHQLLVNLQKEWNSETAGIIVIEPSTGKVLIMESSPTFNLNDRPSDVSLYSNPLVENVYEMGSIIKPLTVAAGLDSGVITPTSRYYDRGDIVINGRHIRNFDGKARGDVAVQEILSQSLNVGTVHVVQKMGGKLFAEYMTKYGLTEETGIDLPNEATPLVSNLSSKVEVDYLTAGFGQGIAISPIQTVRALAVLANGGKLVDPYIVDSIDYERGGTKTIVPNTPEQVISPETAEETTRMLVKVVDTALKGGKYKIPEYSVAAKTGTAQIARPHGGYYEDRYLHSFFGYFPAYDPKFVVFMFHTNPKGAKYASDTLTEPFFKLAKYLLNYYGVPPDRDKETGQKLLKVEE